MIPVSPLLQKSVRGTSATDRLEADKAKYVKTPQVIERRQNPAINASLTPTVPQRSFTSNSCVPQREHCLNNSINPSMQRKTISQHCDKLRTDQYHCLNVTPTIPRRPLQPHHRTEAQADQNTATPSTSTKQNLRVSHDGNQQGQTTSSPHVHPQCLRRVSARRLYRPDSLIIYRQRRGVTLPGKENSEDGPGLVIRLLQGTPLLKRSNPLSRNSTHQRPQEIPASPREQKSIEGSLVCQPSCLLVPEKQKTAWDEQTFTTPTDVEKFFESCGLEGSLLNLLGNFYKMSGDTPLGSLESVNGVSGARGAPLNDDKEEKTPVSVIERNARVIKWIYSCQQARAVGGHKDKQIARESTV
ncbi:protein FAM110D [Spea bombifrons]|uniref:protein FAM110D n=1 Tax=Spea bombifrons TaxID=233779 RepID=UPI0023498D28|nr:protein FAM110D [Spea bombifrons]